MRNSKFRLGIELGAIGVLLSLSLTAIPAGASPPPAFVTGAGVGVSVGSVIGQLKPTNGHCVDNSGPISVGPASTLAAGAVSNIELEVNSNCQVVILSASLNSVATPNPSGGQFTTVASSSSTTTGGASTISSATCTGESGWVKTTDLGSVAPFYYVTGSEVRSEATWNSCGGTPYLREDTNSSDTYCYSNFAVNTTTTTSCAHTVTNTSFNTGYMRGQGDFDGLCGCGQNGLESLPWNLYGQFNVTAGFFAAQGGLYGGTLPYGDHIDVQSSYT